MEKFVCNIKAAAFKYRHEHVDACPVVPDYATWLADLDPAQPAFEVGVAITCTEPRLG